MNNIHYILDASAVLAILHSEPGAAMVLECVKEGTAICAVNYCEIIGKCVEVGVERETFIKMFKPLNIAVIPFNESLARKTGELKEIGKKHGLSLADRACLALSSETGVPAVTADRVWPQTGLGHKVLLIREA